VWSSGGDAGCDVRLLLVGCRKPPMLGREAVVEVLHQRLHGDDVALQVYVPQRPSTGPADLVASKRRAPC